MKIIGLVGGISWVSTIDYYKIINQTINARLGGLNFAECIIYSFNYGDIKKNNDANDWTSTLNILTNACQHLERSGASAIVLCANTMHHIADDLSKQITIPLIHIASVTASEIKKRNIKKAGLLGTKFTMELDFFKKKLLDHGIEALIPDEADRAFVHTTIFEELGRGIINAKTKERYVSIIQKLIASGAEGIILGCTEIPLIIQQENVAVPVFDTTLIHANAAVDFSLG